MRLESVAVNNLFGIFRHYIPLNSEERITIIHGPNGYGKTAILRLIYDIFSSRHTAIKELPFDSVVLRFDTGISLTVTKVVEEKTNEIKSILYESEGCDPFDLLNYGTIEPHLNQLARYLPNIARIGPDEWYHHSTGESFGIEELLEKFGDQIPQGIADLPYPEWLAKIRDALEVHFIRATRLESARVPSKPPRRKRRRSSSAVVSMYAEELSDHIQERLARYAELSQSLDRSFPQRLVGADGVPSLTMEQIREKLAALEQKRNRLTDAGLLDKEAGTYFDVSTIDESKAEVLTLYIADVEQKLAVFDDLYSRIDLLKSILNRRFSFKTVHVDKTNGLEFYTPNRGMLPPEHLSSGEQHEVVLLYQLLFRVKAQSLILIDEPELSLHVAWQEQFLEDLAHITSITSFDVLVATHSPQIISDRWDLTVELQAPSECENTSARPA